MDRITVAAAVLGALTVSAAAQNVPATVPARLTPQQVEMVKRTVRDALKDPESARFDRPFLAARAAAGDMMVCGLVNARNGYGGYTGRNYVIGTIPAAGSPFALDRITSGPRQYAEAREACQAVGIALD